MAGSRAATSRGDDVSRGKGKARASVGVAAGERARDGDAHAGGSATAAVAPATASTRGASRAAAPSAAAAEAAAGGAAAASKIAEAEAESALLCQEVADNVMRHAPAETLAALECTASALRGRTEHAAKAQALARHPGLTLAEARRQARVGGAWAAAGAGAPARYNTRRAAAADAAHAAGPQRVPWSWKRTLRALEIYEHAAFVVGGFNKNWMSPNHCMSSTEALMVTDDISPSLPVAFPSHGELRIMAERAHQRAAAADVADADTQTQTQAQSQPLFDEYSSCDEEDLEQLRAAAARAEARALSHGLTRARACGEASAVDDAGPSSSSAGNSEPALLATPDRTNSREQDANMEAEIAEMRAALMLREAQYAATCAEEPNPQPSSSLDSVRPLMCALSLNDHTLLERMRAAALNGGGDTARLQTARARFRRFTTWCGAAAESLFGFSSLSLSGGGANPVDAEANLASRDRRVKATTARLQGFGPPPLSDDVADIAAARLGRHVLCIGGRNGTQDHATVVTWDPARGPDSGWQALAPLPSARSCLAAAAVAGAAGVELMSVCSALPMAGGADGALGPRYGPAAGMLDASEGAAVVALGGWQRQTDPQMMGMSEVLLYDAAADAWRRLPDMVYPRLFCTAASVPCDRGRLHVVGGIAVANGSLEEGRRMEVFDPGSGRWLPTALPEGRHNGNTIVSCRWGAASCAMPDGRMLIAGGGVFSAMAGAEFEALHSPVTASCIALDPRVPGTDAITELPDLPNATWGAGAIRVGNQVLVVGGNATATGGSYPHIWALDSRMPSHWRYAGSMTVGRWCFGVSGPPPTTWRLQHN